MPSLPRSHNIVGRWVPSAGATGFRLVDRVRSNHGTLTNMDPASDWVANGGKLALDFDGSNDHVTTTCPGVTTTRRALSVWFRTSITLSNGQFAGVVRWGTATTFPADQGKDFAVMFGTDTNFGTNGFGVSQYGNGVAAAGFNDGKWHHGYIDSVGSLYSVYVDGVFRTSKTMTTNATAGTVVIGRSTYGGADYFSGQLDDITIFNTALTPNEVAQIYRLGRGYGVFPEPDFDEGFAAAGFKAYWAKRQSQLIGGGV